MGVGRRRWLASERVAVTVLERLGYRVLGEHVKIEVDGVEVGEVDFIAEGPDGERYAVEVKAGRLDVSGIRQAYVNALVLNAKPLVVCKGFADDAAAKLAEKLGVRVIELSDVFLVDSEELEALVEAAVAEVAAEVLELLVDPRARPKPGEVEVLRAIAEEPTLYDAARRLGKSLRELRPVVEKLKATRIGRRGPQGLRLAARLVLAAALLDAMLDRLERSARALEEAAGRLGGVGR